MTSAGVEGALGDRSLSPYWLRKTITTSIYLVKFNRKIFKLQRNARFIEYKCAFFDQIFKFGSCIGTEGDSTVYIHDYYLGTTCPPVENSRAHHWL